MLDLELESKVALNTGGSDGLGRATAFRLASEGAHVVICARREDHRYEAAGSGAVETGAEVLAVPAHVSQAADCARVIDETVARLGGVDILVNNAGTSLVAEFGRDVGVPMRLVGLTQAGMREVLDAG